MLEKNSVEKSNNKPEKYFDTLHDYVLGGYLISTDVRDPSLHPLNFSYISYFPIDAFHAKVFPPFEAILKLN